MTYLNARFYDAFYHSQISGAFSSQQTRFSPTTTLSVSPRSLIVSLKSFLRCFNVRFHEWRAIPGRFSRLLFLVVSALAHSSHDDRSRRKKRSIRRVIYFARRRTILSHRVRVYINIHRVSRRDSETRHSEIDAAASWPTSSTLLRPTIVVFGRNRVSEMTFEGFYDVLAFFEFSKSTHFWSIFERINELSSFNMKINGNFLVHFYIFFYMILNFV